MKKGENEPAEYAMYRGDQFIDLGTVTYLAEKYHKKKVKQEIAYIDFLISRNNQKLKEYTKDKSPERPVIGLASALSILGLSFYKAILVKQLKQGMKYNETD